MYSVVVIDKCKHMYKKQQQRNEREREKKIARNPSNIAVYI